MKANANPGKIARAEIREEVQTRVWTIKTWCDEAKCASSTLYGWWQRGCGPKKVRVGACVRILESPWAYFSRAGEEEGGKSAA